MERIEEQLSGADKRRELRRGLERDVGNINKFSMNDLMLAGIVLIAMVLSFGDLTFSLGDVKNFTALTLFLYVVTTIVYRNRYNRGKLRGRSDPEYIEALTGYRKVRGKITELGIVSKVPAFCQHYKTTELKEYRMGILADVDMDYDEYIKEYRQLSNRYIRRLPLRYHTRKAIIKCNKAKPIRLTPGLILNESGEADRNKLIGQSGRERERMDKFKNVIWRGITVILGCLIAYDIIFNFSLLTIVRWLGRMLPIVSAVIMGDDGGFCDIAVTETNFKQGQTSIIHLFFEYDKAMSIPEETVSENTTTE